MIEATDLDRATNTGRIFNLHRATLAEPGAIVTDNDAEQMMPAEVCTEIGAGPHGWDRRSAAARFWRRYLLVLAAACIAGAVAWLG